MKKAKFVRKYYGRGYDRDFVYMDYEYRGHEYTVYENRAKGRLHGSTVRNRHGLTG